MRPMLFQMEKYFPEIVSDLPKIVPYLNLDKVLPKLIQVLPQLPQDMQLHETILWYEMLRPYRNEVYSMIPKITPFLPELIVHLPQVYPVLPTLRKYLPKWLANYSVQYGFLVDMMLPKLVPIISDIIPYIEELLPELTEHLPDVPDAPPQMMEQAMAKMQMVFQSKVDPKLLEKIMKSFM